LEFDISGQFRGLPDVSDFAPAVRRAIPSVPNLAG
jgi:hypothetical protein